MFNARISLVRPRRLTKVKVTSTSKQSGSCATYESPVDVESLVAAFLGHRFRHQPRKHSTAPVGLAVTYNGEPEIGQSPSVVDHLDEVNFVELSRCEEWRMYLQKQLFDVVGQSWFFVDEVAQERPLGRLHVNLQYVQHSLRRHTSEQTI